MNVAIIGSEDPRSIGQALDYITTLPHGATIVTVRERGVSRGVHEAAVLLAMPTRVFLTRFQEYGTPYSDLDYRKRDRDMMPHIDWLICFHDAATAGREALMAMALSRGKRVLVYTPGESAAWGDARHTG